MTRIRFLVLAHEHAPSVWRLCDRLLSAPDASVTVQWDSATPLPPRPAELDVVLQSSPAPSEWGNGAQFDAVRAALLSLTTAPFDWLVVLSGACYPIRPLAELTDLLGTTSHQAFLETPTGGTVLPPADTGDTTLTYLQRRYYFRYRWVPRRAWRRLPPRAQHLLEAGGQRAVRAVTSEERVWVQRRPRGFSPGIGHRLRTHPFTADRPCRKGSDWFALARPVYDDLVEELAANPALVEHFRHTYCPNEAVFHTLLLPRWERANAGRNLHFRRFLPNRAHPELLREADWDEMVASRQFLARKFDPANTALLDRVDRELLGA